ncbi:hypothetical protein [Sinorhizobium meliloti]|uniref:hypothetical protein n=1 Tax=Rhizobium meliloti TaxID=382 RepID=UPI0003FB6E18|nr:hypothetical protein [Sinorhizobium meliloti]
MYLGYKLDPDRVFDLHNTRNLLGDDKGTVVPGMRRKMSDLLSASAEPAKPPRPRHIRGAPNTSEIVKMIA